MNRLFKIFIVVITLSCIFIPCVSAIDPDLANGTNTSNAKSNSSSTQTREANADFMETGRYTSCGGVGDSALIKKIPVKIPGITKMVYNAFMIVTPTILVIMGSIDLFRGITSSKEDEIKKGRDTFLRRLIAAVIVFLIVLGVKLLVSLIAGSSDNSARIIECINCFVSNTCGEEYVISDETE